MIIVGTSLGLFLIAMILHWIIWQFWLPSREQVFLLFHFILLLLIGIFSLRWIYIFSTGQVSYLIACYLALAFSYIITYCAISEDSPSLLIVKQLYNLRQVGCTAKTLHSIIDEQKVLDRRIKQLINSNAIFEKNGAFFLTADGIKWVKIFQRLDRIMNIRKGG